jgi:hypothetical protein
LCSAVEGHSVSTVSELIVSVDWSEVHPGELDELRAAMTKLVDFVDTNELRPLAYNVYFDEYGTRMTVFQIHPDSASMEYHMKVAGPEFAKLKDMLTLSAIEIYGTPSERLLDQLREKARLLGGATVTVHERHAGFARLSAESAP